MESHDGNNQEPDWVNRWALKLNDAVRIYWPPARDWIKRSFQRTTDAVRTAWPPTRNFFKRCCEAVVPATRRAWPPTRDWITHYSHLLRQRWVELSINRKRIAIGVGCGVALLVLLSLLSRPASSGHNSKTARLGDTVDDSEPPLYDPIDVAKFVVTTFLTVPKSAEFAPMQIWKISPVRVRIGPTNDYKLHHPPPYAEYNDQIETEYESWIEHQNAYGTQVRSHFFVRLRTANVPDGYAEKALSDSYYSGIKIPKGKIHVTLLRLNNSKLVEPSREVFYDPSTGILEY